MVPAIFKQKESMMKKKIWLVCECLIAAALVGAAVWYFKYGSTATEQKGGRKAAIPVVTTLTLEKKVVPVNIESLGNTVANESIVLTAVAQETVREIRFNEGDFVKKNQLLITLESEQEQVALDQAKLAREDAVLDLKEAEFAQEEANLRLQEAELKLNEAQLKLNEAELDLEEAEREKKRLGQLYHDNAISEKDFDIQKTQFDRAKIQRESAKAQVGSAKTQVGSARTQVESAKNNVSKANTKLKTAETQIKSAETQLADRQVVAPFDGIIGKRQISLGTLVSPGTPIATLDDITRIKVDFNVPEKNLAKLCTGQKFYAESAAFPGEKFQGTIQLIDTHLNTTTRSVEVRGILDNIKDQSGNWKLHPGMLLYLTIELDSMEQIVIPEKAVQSLGEIHYIYIYDPSTKKVSRREVKTGNRAGGNVVLLSGAKDGEIYVDEGISKLSDGATVKLAGE